MIHTTRVSSTAPKSSSTSQKGKKKRTKCTSEFLTVKAHLLPSPIGLKPFFSLLSYFLSYIYLSLACIRHIKIYPSRHLVLSSFSLTYRSSSSSLTYQHGIRATLEGEIDLPCCICLSCRRLFALLPANALTLFRAGRTLFRVTPPGRYSCYLVKSPLFRPHARTP